MAKVKDPHAVRYKRWRNIPHKYLVDVLEVKSYSGPSKVYRTVLVRRVKGHEERTWPTEVFLKTFEPIGRRIRTKTAWELLQE